MSATEITGSAILLFVEENKTYIELSSCNEEKSLKFMQLDNFQA